MGQDMWKDAFAEIDLPAETKRKVWDRLVQAESERKSGNYIKNYKKKSVGRWAVAAVVLSCFLGIVLVNIHTEGKIVEALQRLWKVDELSREVVEHTVSYPFETLSAPQLIDCCQERIILGSSMGLIVYDREEKRVVGTIDLKEIDCCYFEGDTLLTRFLPEEDRLTIYNHREGKKTQGTCYVYDLAECHSLEEGEVKTLKPAETAAVSASLEKRWKEYTRKHHRNTFERSVYGKYNALLQKMREECYIFSEKPEEAVFWRDESGKRYFSCLAFKTEENDSAKSGKREWRFVLCSGDRDTGEQEEETLELKAEMPDVIQEEALPAYEYQTEDPVRKALADCARENLSLYNGCIYGAGKYLEISSDLEGLPVVPSIDIYHVKEGKKYTKVYGVFSAIALSRFGNMLCGTRCWSDTFITCAYLKKTSDGYKVVKMVHPRDGAYIWEDVKAMCDGDGKLARKLYKQHVKPDKKGQKTVVEMIREYVSDNRLDIQYFQWAGENPIKLQ